MIYTIDQIIEAHWAGCDVLAGETPEDFASRHEQARSSITWVLLDDEPLIFCQAS